jgi:G patch domain-containing protein 1
MTGFMASRFTTSTNKPTSNSGSETEEKDLLSTPPPKPQDPAEEAAKLGMFGPMTRSVADFYPTRLLCKRFNVKPPEHVQPDDQPSATGTARTSYDSAPQFNVPPDLSSVRQEPLAGGFGSGPPNSAGTPDNTADFALAPTLEQATAQAPVPEKTVVDASRNEALEGKRAGEDVFKAIFGDSDDED